MQGSHECHTSEYRFKAYNTSVPLTLMLRLQVPDPLCPRHVNVPQESRHRPEHEAPGHRSQGQQTMDGQEDGLDAEGQHEEVGLLGPALEEHLPGLVDQVLEGLDGDGALGAGLGVLVEEGVAGKRYCLQ